MTTKIKDKDNYFFNLGRVLQRYDVGVSFNEDHYLIGSSGIKLNTAEEVEVFIRGFKLAHDLLEGE